MEWVIIFFHNMVRLSPPHSKKPPETSSAVKFPSLPKKKSAEVPNAKFTCLALIKTKPRKDKTDWVIFSKKQI